MKDRYIKLLLDFYNQHNKSPKRRDFANYSTQFAKVFGSWNNALEAAGLPILREAAPSKEKLIDSLKDFYATQKKSPRAADCLNKNGLYDTKTYLRYLKKNSWAKVLRMAGLLVYVEHSKDLDLDEEALLLKIKNFITKNGIGSYYEYNKKKGGLPSGQYLSDRYGSWNNFMKAAGLEVNQFKYTKEFFVDKIESFVREKAYAPSLSELAQTLDIPTRVITSYIGTYNHFIESLGYVAQFSSPEAVAESKAQLKQLYIDFSKKHGYENGAPSRALNASSEIYNMDVFCIRFGSLNELRGECGFKIVFTNGKKRYTREEIKLILRHEYKTSGKKLTMEEIKKRKNLPPVSTILRYFKTTAIDKVWDEVLKNEN